jgi:probable HAF family extracellular repeat protein
MSVDRLHKVAAALGAATLLANVALTGTASAETADHDRDDQSSQSYRFEQAVYSLNGTTDTRFTQLLGVNTKGIIAGYHGDENTENTPNKGFRLKLSGRIPSAELNFADENFPGSDQTQVIGINNDGDTVGFYVTGDTTHGFMKADGKDSVTVDLPGTTFNQLLGINNKGQAAGYFQDNALTPLQHAYVRDANGDFRVLNLPMPSSQATGINDKGTIVGFLQASTADTHSSGFVLKNGKVTELNFPGSTFTQALGINNSDDVVGTFTDANATQHGFVYENGRYRTIDFTGGNLNVSGTIVNGINDHDEIVGFFQTPNNSGQTDTRGFIGVPSASAR